MLYILFLILLLVCSIVIICFMPKFKNTRLTNTILVLLTVIPYLALMLIIYLDVGANDWNFTNTLPVANVSPFMFFTLPIFFVLPQTIKKYYLVLIALLSVGMVLSPTFSCIYNTVINYKFHAHFLLNYISHFSLFLLGIYLVKSKQVELNTKNCLIGASIIIGAALVMMLLNVIFDTAFFGLSLNGKHNIYNNVLVENSYLSALIYFIGLIGIMVLGFLFHKLINKNKKEL